MIYVPHCPTPVRSITSEREVGPLTCDLAMLTFDKLQKKCPDQTQHLLQESTAIVTMVAKTETSLAFDSNYIA